ncbi:sensor histidine kinase [Pseudonocardia humida]|uniref:histidine kinase n=1 Tax=Pseudonocardia humida TaxID=2800819 RepID=A0ABT0ZY17_9PSEU|nr:sensor histidine kinase [Pseudonocardia humida]MCO1655544.1 sensor domain-containing protein [Pseudonocardia humida]
MPAPGRATAEPATTPAHRGGVRRATRRLSRSTLVALDQLGAGLGTALLALVALLGVVLVGLACLLWVGRLLVPVALQVLRLAADRERARLGRYGPEIVGPGPVPTGLRAAAADPTTRRELGWLALHGTAGLLLSVVGLTLPLSVITDVTFPLWWYLLPPDDATPSLVPWTVQDWPTALAVVPFSLVWLVLTVGLSPVMARLQSRPGWRLLPPDPETDLSVRVAELTATRAAALDAHAVELRRIERSLHDGAQNRLVAVTVLVGAARRALARDPAAAADVLGRAQDAAEQALAELRTVVRSILPPVLADRGLEGSLAGLAAACPVPCRLEVDLDTGAGRCAASVEATAYFVVAEALTNIAKHSGARAAAVAVSRRADRLLVRVDDDGKGGADGAAGSGLAGIRRRAEAFDGRFALTSPPGGPTTIEVELPCGS